MGTLNTKIYILHGWTYKLDKWKRFGRLLSKSNIVPIYLKVPGLTTKSTKVWNLDKYSEWLREEISTDSSKVILLGHSNGGRIAAYFAAKYPNRVRNLILVDSAGIIRNDLFSRIKKKVFKLVSSMGKKVLPYNITARNIIYRLIGESDYNNALPNMKLTMVNLINSDLTPSLAKISVPTLIVWGDEDKVTPIGDAFVIKNLVKNSKLRIIKGAKHAPFYSHPKNLLTILKNDL